MEPQSGSCPRNARTCSARPSKLLRLSTGVVASQTCTLPDRITPPPPSGRPSRPRSRRPRPREAVGPIAPPPSPAAAAPARPAVQSPSPPRIPPAANESPPARTPHKVRERRGVTGRLKTSHFGALQNQPVVYDVIHSMNDFRQAFSVHFMMPCLRATNGLRYDGSSRRQDRATLGSDPSGRRWPYGRGCFSRGSLFCGLPSLPEAQSDKSRGAGGRAPSQWVPSLWRSDRAS